MVVWVLLDEAAFSDSSLSGSLNLRREYVGVVENLLFLDV
jgi:hypothetical protein